MLKGLLVIVGTAVVTALLVNHLSPRGIAWFGDWDAAQGVVTAKPKNDVVVHDREINDIRAVKAVFDKAAAVFVDARTAESFAEGHIKGAVSMPVAEMEQSLGGFMNRYPSQTHIITYCSGRSCDDSHILAESLMELGYTHVQVFVGGFVEWEKEGYPIE